MKLAEIEDSDKLLNRLDRIEILISQLENKMDARFNAVDVRFNRIDAKFSGQWILLIAAVVTGVVQIVLHFLLH